MSTKFKKPLNMTNEEEQEFETAAECHICGQKCGNKDIRVWDQCHITGQYKGLAHQDRNLKLRINPKQFKIPVIFHNLQGYDSHFIMQEIGTIGKEHDLEINCIPNNIEKYMAFMLGKHLLFLDSFQFMDRWLLIFLRTLSNIYIKGFSGCETTTYEKGKGYIPMIICIVSKHLMTSSYVPKNSSIVL